MPRPLDPNSAYGWKKLVRARDGNKCVLCGSTERLQVDHIKPFSLFPELARVLSNGRVLCFDCHKKTDTFGAKLLKGRTVDRNPYGSR